MHCLQTVWSPYLFKTLLHVRPAVPHAEQCY